MRNKLIGTLKLAFWGGVFFGIFGSSAFGQAQTFVSATGLDTNPCTVTSPCKTINHALGTTNAGGEVIILNSGVYAPFTINKAVTVEAGSGAVAQIAAPTGDAIDISAGSSDTVAIRGLTVYNQGGSGNYGIRFSGGSVLQIENCVVNGFGSVGIGILNGVYVSIRNTITRNNYDGVYIAPTGPILFVAMDHVRADANQNGIVVYGATSDPPVAAVIHNSTFSDNAQFGALIIGAVANAAFADFDNCEMTGDGTGILVGYGLYGQASISNCTIDQSVNTGYVINGSGVLYSLGNNTLIGNPSNAGSLTPLAMQ